LGLWSDPVSTPDLPDTPAAGTVWASGLDSSWCDLVGQMLGTVSKWPKHRFKYDWTSLNSNSAANFVGSQAGVPSIDPGWDTLGWGTVIDLQQIGRRR